MAAADDEDELTYLKFGILVTDSVVASSSQSGYEGATESCWIFALANNTMTRARVTPVLTGPLRTLAGAAAGGSVEHLHRILLKWEDLSERSSRLLLPIFYSVLDTADTITLPDQLESWDAEDVQFAVDLRVDQTLLSFQGLTHLFLDGLIHQVAVTDLWPRVWGWTEFLDAFCEQLPICKQNRTEIYAIATALLCSMLQHYHSEVLRLFIATPGIHGVIGRAWIRLLSAKHDQGLCDISLLLLMLVDPEHVVNFPELVAGTGGSWTDIASAVVSHLKQAFPNTDTPITSVTLYRVGGVKSILSYAFTTNFSLRTTLLEKGLVKVLTIILLALSKANPLPPNLAVLYDGFPQFAIVCVLISFRISRSHRWIAEALRAGFLRALFSSVRKCDTGTIDELSTFLSKYLPGSTVYYSMLIQLHAALVEIQDLEPASCFKTLVADWNQLIDLVHMRMKVADEFKSGSLTALRACDNLACLTRFYCSRSCQKADWRNGHRSICHDLRERYIDNAGVYSSRDRAFLRALLHHDYIRQQEDIAFSALRFMHTNRSKLPYFQFDYTHGGQCKVSLATEPDKRQEIETLYGDDIRRTVFSGGRMQIHLMTTEDAHEATVRSIPLRVGSTPVYQMLLALAESLPPPTNGKPVDYESYRGIIQEALLSTVQTH
ncbi:hypothetical protein GGX14DRAFT_391802 [Mycena pura]|uniref:MYND-type domain-containing protein n=1 Tax=Mycena pura TaxID=153505 RepID=A0AAD6YG48_9AGAR|nr:hypothetical protein GGX14DRAFT_391802 [Mycena pura]